MISFRCESTRRSKDFITTEVRATGLKSLSPVDLGFLGTGMIVEALKQVGTEQVSSEVLKMSEHWRQLISAVLQGGWRNRMWSSSFPGVLSPEEFVDVFHVWKESTLRWVEGWAFKVGIGRGAQAAAEVGEVEVI